MGVDHAARALVVAEYRASGMTQAEFAASRGMKLSALQAWIYRGPSSPRPPRGVASKAARAPRFVEVSPGKSTMMVELQLGELLVRSAGFPPPQWVAALLVGVRA